MRVLITGANGMLARAAADHCRSIGDEVYALTRAELDITDGERVDASLTEIRPEAVLNCAAYTDVDGAESDEIKCFAVNADGVENLAKACRKISAGFLTVSTDYVFGGESSDFYNQRDTPEPKGVYARSKLEGEHRAKNEYARSVIVRSGWIYGADGANFLSIVDRLLREGRTVKAIVDSFGTPTYAADLAVRIRELADLDIPCTFHVTNEGPGTSFFGFASKVCEIGGYDAGLLEAVTMDQLTRAAPRPVSSKLACLLSGRLGLAKLPHWESALASYLRKTK